MSKSDKSGHCEAHEMSPPRLTYRSLNLSIQLRMSCFCEVSRCSILFKNDSSSKVSSSVKRDRKNFEAYQDFCFCIESQFDQCFIIRRLRRVRRTTSLLSTQIILRTDISYYIDGVITLPFENKSFADR